MIQKTFEEREESHIFKGRSAPALLLADVPKYIYPPTAGKGLDQSQTFAVFFSMKQKAVKEIWARCSAPLTRDQPRVVIKLHSHSPPHPITSLCVCGCGYTCDCGVCCWCRDKNQSAFVQLVLINFSCLVCTQPQLFAPVQKRRLGPHNRGFI